MLLGKKRTIKDDFAAQTAPIAFACSYIQVFPYILNPEVNTEKPLKLVVEQYSIIIE